LARIYEGKVTVVKINVDDNTQTLSEYGVSGVPFLLLFKNGKAVAGKAGVYSKSQAAVFLDINL